MPNNEIDPQGGPSGPQPFLPISAPAGLAAKNAARDGRLLSSSEYCVGAEIEWMLKRAGLTVNAAAKALGMSPANLRQYTRGRRQNPSFAWFLRVAELCGCEIRAYHNDAS